MPITTDFKNANELIQCVATRADGSVRQLLLQDQQGNVISRAFFPPKTFRTDPDWKSKKMYHWIDAFSDEELLDPNNELIFTPEMLTQLRIESKIANGSKTIVVDDLNKYKKTGEK